ncbi:hypothetical protein [Bradyrhizobium sp. 5.13L]
MSATIIDFNAFKANRRAAVKIGRDAPSSTVLEGALAPLFFFPLFLTWMPFCPMTPAGDQETT